MFKKLIGLVMIGSLFLVGCGSTNDSSESKKREINMSVAASLKVPMEEIKKNFEEKNNITVNLNFGPSGTLQKQIEDDAPVDIFLSAGKENVDDLIKKDYIKEENSKDFLGNSLVLVKSNESKSQINSFKDLKLGNIKIAVAEKSAPLGLYTKEAFNNVGILKDVESSIIYCKDAKATISYVEKGEVDFAIIYDNDSPNLKSSKVIEKIESKLHSPIIYPLATIKNSKEKVEVKDFIEYLTSEECKNVLKQNNFIVR